MDVIEFKNLLWDYTRKIGEHTNILTLSLCENLDLTIVQVRILVEIKQHGSHTIGSLAQCLNMAGTNISTMCKKLEGLGYLERVRDRSDERVVKVALTDKGIIAVEEMDKMLLEKISTSINGVPEETLFVIINGMTKLNEILENVNKQ
ncbi:MarR family winged helix-turn-helix transcriptional regulator [Bacillus sp. FJAT-18017]|uniref:MarR family winged helix-turn-helix transcriptional regulator n=1 Tax=Bacillus sp. FJAT-18017 TaxID=1705566 RepID=UPI0006B04CC0|nr:MarR family transcriptional regulator [Bacillus sp. FJAT-18017]